MPLPADGIIHLAGYSRPGETSQSRSKQAMIIRMSDKILDLLESMPQLHFEFADNPGLTIGDTFFPVNSVQETSPHDLYLRTSSAARRNAPLKLYASVTGKFAVERQLDDRITDKVRASTADAQSQRAGRTTIFVDTPTDLPPPNGKKKTTMFRKPVRPADQPRRPVPPSSGGASPAPPQPQRSKDALQALRRRMIRCIAVAERTSEQVVKLVGGNDSSVSLKQDILDLLDEIAEPIPLPSNSKAPKNYRLKTTSWLEVRPYDTPGLSESEKTSMARSAKLALRDLKIPESDPAWSHVQYRNPNGTTSFNGYHARPADGVGSSKAAQGPELPKRGITSASAKEKKTMKPKDTGEIMWKDESLKASTSRPSTNNMNRDGEPGRSLLQKPPASRPRPGSGFKAKQPTPTESREFASGRSPIINGKRVLGEPSNSIPDPRRVQTSNSSQTSDRRVSGAQTQKVERLRRDDVPPSDSERSDRVRDGERGALKGKERNREREDRNREKVRTDRETDRERERQRDRERERREPERQREWERTKRRETDLESDRERDRPRKKPRDQRWSEEGEPSDDGPRPSKRKKVLEDDVYESSSRTAVKKRKIDSPQPRNNKPRDLTLPKKPEPPRLKPTKKESSPFTTLPKIPKESSPLPSVPKIKKEPTSLPKFSAPLPKTSPSTTSSQLSNSKPRPKRPRPEDIYTSSEDEGEIRVSTKREPAPSNIPITNNNNRNEVPPQTRLLTSKPPPPHDHTALRAHYETSYLPYLGNFQRLMKHKTKIRNLLMKMDKGSSGSVTESDGDGELLDPEDLKKLALEYHSQHENLEDIQRIFSRRDQ